MPGPTAGPDPWGRRRLIRTLATITGAALLLLGGLGYAIHEAATAATPTPTAAHHPLEDAARLPGGQARRDAIAAAPMLSVPPEAARSGVPATGTITSIRVPAATGLGPAGVPTGFPHTRQGAIGQLAAITTTVLQGMSIERAGQVHHAWTEPGAVSLPDWELTGSIQAFLASSAGQNPDATRGAVTAIPVAAQVKGVDGTDWVLACVLLDVTARLTAQARIGYGHCERMQWTPRLGGRWVIGAGAAPARAPSTWPGSHLAQQAGWAPVTLPSGPDATVEDPS